MTSSTGPFNFNLAQRTASSTRPPGGIKTYSCRRGSSRKIPSRASTSIVQSGRFSASLDSVLPPPPSPLVLGCLWSACASLAEDDCAAGCAGRLPVWRATHNMFGAPAIAFTRRSRTGVPALSGMRGASCSLLKSITPANLRGFSGRPGDCSLGCS